VLTWKRLRRTAAAAAAWPGVNHSIRWIQKAQKWSWFKNCSKWLQMVPNSHINQYFDWSNSAKKLTRTGKWPKVKSVRTLPEWLQMVHNIHNSHINWYFGPIQPKSLPKLENGQKWNWFEHCLKWPQMGPNSHTKWYCMSICPKSWPRFDVPMGHIFSFEVIRQVVFEIWTYVILGLEVGISKTKKLFAKAWILANFRVF